jgi:CHASE2 domain-containing sensor protein
MRRLKRFWTSPLLPGALVLLAIFALQVSGVSALDRIGDLFFDTYQRAAPRAPSDAPTRNRSAASGNGPGPEPRSPG